VVPLPEANNLRGPRRQAIPDNDIALRWMILDAAIPTLPDAHNLRLSGVAIFRILTYEGGSQAVIMMDGEPS
jgi:hypothetical protein